MFSNFQQQQQQNNLFQPSHECQTSEEDETRSSGGPSPITAHKPFSVSCGDGSTVEIGRRPRGRPPGSKNKPKTHQIIINRQPDPAMSSHILEIPEGSDVVEAIARFSNRRKTGLCILSGSGTVANVTLRQISAPPGTTVTFHGRFNILSISATFFSPSEPSPPIQKEFSISLAGPQGQIVGGFVVGRLLAVSAVFVIAASNYFGGPKALAWAALPLGRPWPLEEDVMNNSVSGGGGEKSPPQHTGGGESCMYSAQLPSDVIWATTPRTHF